MPRRWRMGVTLLILLLLAALASGCGELGGDTRPKARAPVVSERDLERYEPGTPGRAFLEWFRALQRRDSRELADHYVQSLGLTPATLAHQREAGAYAIDPLAPPLIERVNLAGSEARVLAHFRTGRVYPNGRVDYEKTRVVPIAMRREGGRWLLADNGFLELVARDATGVLDATEAGKPPAVGRRQLSRYPAGSPARAFLEWFGALQRSDARKAARYYAPGLGLSARELARQRERADTFDSFGPPRIVRVARRGQSATVTVRTRTVTSQTGSEFGFKESPPIAFVLRNVGGRWVLRNNGFVEVLMRVPTG